MIRGDRINERMKELELTQAELARGIGVSQQAIGKLINGKSRATSHIARIARVLRTTPAYLEGETDDVASEMPDLEELAPDEQRLLEIYRQLPKEDRASLRQLMRRLANTEPPEGEGKPAGATLHSPKHGYRSEE